MKFEDIGIEPSSFKSAGRTLQFKKRVSSASKCLSIAQDALKGFTRGAYLFGVTKGQFSAIDLAAAVLNVTGPADVTVWTWCISSYEVEAFSMFLTDRRIRSFRLVCDWSMAKRDMPLVAELQARFGPDCLRISKNHAKIVTISTPGADGWRLVIRGSMNLNFNPRFEQFDVSDCPDIFDVVAGMESELWKRGQPLPVAKLRHADAVNLLNAGEVTAPSPAWAENLNLKRWW